MQTGRSNKSFMNCRQNLLCLKETWLCVIQGKLNLASSPKPTLMCSTSPPSLLRWENQVCRMISRFPQLRSSGPGQCMLPRPFLPSSLHLLRALLVLT